MPVHVRHHWVMAILRRVDTTIPEMIVFDSAPSPITRSDVRKLARALEIPVEFHSPLRQREGSNECGLFAVLYALVACASLSRLLEYANSGCFVTLDLGLWRAYLEGRMHDLRESDLAHLLELVPLPLGLRRPSSSGTVAGGTGGLSPLRPRCRG